MSKRHQRGLKESYERFRECLKAHRSRLGYSQKQIADGIKKQQSYVANLERGERNPPRNPEVLCDLVDVLRLGPAEAQDLMLSAFGVRYIYDGIPMLSETDVGYEIAALESPRVWIAGPTPLEFNAPPNTTFEAVYERVRGLKTIYTYWLPRKSQEAFDSFVTRIEQQLDADGGLSHQAAMNIECFLADSKQPLPLDLSHYCLYDPFNDARRSGRHAVHDPTGTVSRVTSMSADETAFLFRWLSPIYAELKRRDDRILQLEGATFTRHFP